LRTLEPEAELAGCTMPFDSIGTINEASAKRYLQGQAAWEKKFSHATKSVARNREKNLKLARKESLRTMSHIHTRLVRDFNHRNRASASSSAVNLGSSPSLDETDGPAPQYLLNSTLWSWSWALEGENPPPSSLVARRDTSEARRLSRIADTHLDESDSRLSGNNLWAVVADFLSTGPTRSGSADEDNLRDIPAAAREPSGLGLGVAPPTGEVNNVDEKVKKLSSKKSFSKLFGIFSSSKAR